MRPILEGGERIEWGAKTIPGGGFHALPRRFHAPGLLLCGDGVGMVNVPTLKGVHYAVESGRLAAEAAFAAVSETADDAPVPATRSRRTTTPCARASSGASSTRSATCGRCSGAASSSAARSA